MNVLRHTWHLWPGRHWPALPEEEHQFVTDLQHLTEAQPRTRAKAPPVGREHYTAVLNALRGGNTATELLEFVPGMRPSDLLGAYVNLERLRMRSWQAWHEIVEDPCATSITHNAKDAAVLLQVPMRRVVTMHQQIRDRANLRDAVHGIHEQIETYGYASERLEHALSMRTPPDPAGVSLGTKLHQPKEPTLWGDPYFLANRVTCLSPTRVSDLLEERNQ